MDLGRGGDRWRAVEIGTGRENTSGRQNLSRVQRIDQGQGQFGRMGQSLRDLSSRAGAGNGKVLERKTWRKQRQGDVISHF